MWDGTLRMSSGLPKMVHGRQRKRSAKPRILRFHLSDSADQQRSANLFAKGHTISHDSYTTSSRILPRFSPGFYDLQPYDWRSYSAQNEATNVPLRVYFWYYLR